jgi:hypothetical protein
MAAATSNDNSESLTNDANAVNKDLSSALASGDFIGTPVQNDLLKPDVAQASLDEGALRNAMSQLGADCSQYLSAST